MHASFGYASRLCERALGGREYVAGLGSGMTLVVLSCGCMITLLEVCRAPVLLLSPCTLGSAHLGLMRVRVGVFAYLIDHGVDTEGLMGSLLFPYI